MEFVKIQRHQNNQGGQLLGSLFWWSLNGNSIERSKLEKLAEKHGLDKKYLPNEIRPAGAFRRAVKHASAKLPKGMLLRLINDSDTEIAIGQVKEMPDEQTRDLDYNVEARIIFDKKSHAISSDYENGTSSLIRNLYQCHLSLSTQDLRNMMLSFLKESSIRIRQNGGVYFIASSHHKTLHALCRVVQSAGGNSTYSLPIFDSQNSKHTLRSIAKSSLDAEIRQLTTELEKFDKEKMRDSTLDRKLRNFEEIRSKTLMFSRVLNFKAKAFTDKISEFQNGLRSDLGLKPVEISKPVKARKTIMITPAASDAIAGF